MDREASVRKALSDFLRTHNLHDSVSCVDEVVLTYLLSILDDLGDSSNTEESVDVEHFCEMMAAYVPGFHCIASADVWEWMFSLSEKLSEQSTDSDLQDTYKVTIQSPSVDVNVENSSGWSKSGVDRGRSRTKQRDKSSQCEDETKFQHRDGGVSEFDSQVALLCEMFPDTCAMEVQHCLSVSHGHTDQAVQLILHRQETGNTIIDQAESTAPVKNRGCMLADKELKELTLARYSFVDTDDDKKTYKPPPIKQESKKLIRYREGQVVSTKGEKFTEVKKNDSEDMKKTYVSLKPARKYRFH